jgi:3-oxoacyl-[acyl-carrier protein] reductase
METMSQSVAIVTGASSGIGRATALRLARDYTGIGIVARKKHELEILADEIRAVGSEPLVIDADLSAERSPETVVARTVDRFGRIDALANIAGAVPGIDLFDMTDAQWNAALALKFHGARRLTLEAWDALKASRGGVVMMSGSSADVPTAAQAAIGSINAAIVALAKAFADRGMDDGVQVNSILPGPVLTGRRLGMIQQWAKVHGTTIEQAKADFIEKSGVRRFGEPEEVAELLSYILSPAARWMTGTAVRIDGGEVKVV